MSLYTTYDRTNVFSRILSGDLPCAKVFENDDVLAFMDAFPQAKGHTLIIPKRQAVNLFDMATDDLTLMILHAQKIGRAIRDALEPDGIQVLQYNGDCGGQTVFHYHIHLIPRWYDMTLKSHAKGIMAPLEELKSTAARISAKLAD